MIILAPIPVEKIDKGSCFYFRHETMEVEVMRVFRYPASKNRELNRWHYQADIKDPLSVHPHAIRTGSNGALRVSIQRKGLNGAWKPPAFPEGKNVVEIECTGGQYERP